MEVYCFNVGTLMGVCSHIIFLPILANVITALLLRPGCLPNQHWVLCNLHLVIPFPTHLLRPGFCSDHGACCSLALISILFLRSSTASVSVENAETRSRPTYWESRPAVHLHVIEMEWEVFEEIKPVTCWFHPTAVELDIMCPDFQFFSFTRKAFVGDGWCTLNGTPPKSLTGNCICLICLRTTSPSCTRHQAHPTYPNQGYGSSDERGRVGERPLPIWRLLLVLEGVNAGLSPRLFCRSCYCRRRYRH